MSPINVLSFNDSHKFVVAQIPIKANGISMLGLIDTDAAIPVASCELADLLGIFHLDKSPITSAVGIAGIPISLIGSANLEFQIGTNSVTATVHFTKGPYIPREADSFNISMKRQHCNRRPKPESPATRRLRSRRPSCWLPNHHFWQIDRC
ncbi:hypothetical protein ANCDUO_08636 [Ancylostoma duodenale]|uniref:Peptidase A2 domain-containing protein n=1 Tax=Ancylostoma duodenale TaxID=51022 RepID=A0A0C2DF71_9BILA|nr:hypothetical protein ANCDUO_08636 [Ancylostoma duodenale]